MLNKFKKAVKYIAKKIKQRVEIMTNAGKEAINKVSEVGKEVISGTKDVMNTVGNTAVNRYADHMDKKLDMVKSAAVGLKSTGSSLCNGVKSILKNPTYIKNLGAVLLFTSVGLITVGLTNKEVK